MARKRKQTQQGVNLAQAGQNFFRGGADQTVTEQKLKIGLILGLIIIPFILFILFLGVERDVLLGNDGANLPRIIGDKLWVHWIIGLGWLAISQTVLTVLANKTEKIKPDTFILAFMATGFMWGFYMLPAHGWIRILYMFLMGMAGSMVGRWSFGIRTMIKTIRMARQAQQQMMAMQMAAQQQTDPYAKPQTKEDFKKQQASKMDEAMRRETEMIDQMLREQGIDIDALDREYGSAIDTGKANSFEASEINEFDVTDVEVSPAYGEAEDVEVVDVVIDDNKHH